MTLAQSKKMTTIHADHDQWEETRMVNSGVVRVREVDLDFETEEESKVILLVHDTRPPFLENEVGLGGKKQDSVLPVKDPTSDMAMIARKGSALLTEVRTKRDENKSRDRFWEMKGTAMGNVTGTTRAENNQAMENAEKQRKQAGDEKDDVAGAGANGLKNTANPNHDPDAKKLTADEMEVANFKQGAKFSDHMSAPTEKRSEFSKTKTMKQVRTVSYFPNPGTLFDATL